VKNALKPVKADSGENFYMVDGIVNRQGPNYALAKRIQHWRAMVRNPFSIYLHTGSMIILTQDP
jgi:hypothetical protein